MGVSGHHGYDDADGRRQRPGGFLLLECSRMPSFPTVSLLPSNWCGTPRTHGCSAVECMPRGDQEGGAAQAALGDQQQPGDLVEALQVL